MRLPGLAGPARVAAVVSALVFVLAGCGIAASTSQRPVTPAPASGGPAATVSGAVAQTRTAIATALAAESLQLEDATKAYRTAEPPGVAAAPRAVFQALLPDDPDGGFIVVYEFPDAASAINAGHELAGYLGTGAGRIQFPIDSQHTIRALGTTLIFYTFAPSTSPDPNAPAVARALATLGIGFAPPR